MKVHDDISFFRKPTIWIKDKKDAFLNQKEVYGVAVIPSIFVTISLIADIFGLIKIDGSVLSIFLLSFLFIYGFINLLLTTSIQRSGVRLLRQKTTSEIMHRVVTDKIKEYLTHRNYLRAHNESISAEQIKNHISGIMDLFCSQYLEVYYRKSVCLTVKYFKNNQLYPLRYGNDTGRSNNPESLENSYVYQALSKTRRKLNYIYVKDLTNIDSKERDMLSGFESEIVSRATSKYRTFIAIPIRSGSLKNISESDFRLIPDLGLIGIDLNKPYGFGNLDENEIHVLLCLGDLISELVNDLREK